MNKTIKLRVKKEIDRESELKILKLKGTLITKGFTEIIHIEDENEDFYLNTFSTYAVLIKEAEKYILNFILTNKIDDSVTLINDMK